MTVFASADPCEYLEGRSRALASRRAVRPARKRYAPSARGSRGRCEVLAGDRPVGDLACCISGIAGNRCGLFTDTHTHGRKRDRSPGHGLAPITGAECLTAPGLEGQL